MDIVDVVSIGMRINDLRLQEGLSYQELADRAGIGRTAVWKICNGKIKDPTLTTILSLSDALGVPWAYIVGTREANKEKNKQNRAISSDYTGLPDVVVEGLHNASKHGSCMIEDIYELVHKAQGVWPPVPRYDINFLNEFFVDSKFFSTMNFCLLSMAQAVTKLHANGQKEIGVVDTEVWGAVHSVHRIVEDLCEKFNTRYLQGEGLHSKAIEEYQSQCDIEKNIWRLYGNNPQENK